MTTANERYNSVLKTHEFLKELMWDKDLTGEIRAKAYRCIKHYPWACYMEDVAEKCPEIFENRSEA